MSEDAPKHWVVKIWGTFADIRDEYSTIAQDATHENARLLAAAPDLLLALQMLHDNIAEYARINNLGGFDNYDMRTARAAIAKATGETP